MKSRRLFILDSVGAARDLLSREIPKGEDEILSTHYSVVGFLSARGIACKDFSDFISIYQARTAIENASRDLDATLNQLDSTLGDCICSSAGLPKMAIFHPLFKYLGQYNLAGLRAFQNVLNARLSQGDIATVYYYYALSTSNHAVFSFVAAAAQVCDAHRVTYASISSMPSSVSRFVAEFNKLVALAKRELKSPEKVISVFLRCLRRLPRPPVLISGSRPVAFVLDPSESSFFTTALAERGMQVISVLRQGIAPVKGVSIQEARAMLHEAIKVAIEWQQSESPMSTSIGDLDRRIVSCLIAQASSLLLPLMYAHLIIRTYSICLAAWDLPLVTRPALNLIAEFCMANGLPVLGRQHGANYACQDLGTIHFDSDFNRCTHFLSYGFGQKEFKATYPKAQARCTFIPAGNPPLVVKHSTRPVDIVFPISNCIELFWLARLPESELVDRQARILQAIESKKDLFCVAKPMLGYSEDNFAHMETLCRLRHARIVHASWTSFLKAYRPRLIVLDIASTPLFEALSLDVDIFLMLDHVYPFSDSALAMIRKRVYIFYTVEEMSEAIRQYGVGTLERLRDDEFYRTYVNRGSPDLAFDRLIQLEVPVFTGGGSKIPRLPVDSNA